MCSFLLPFSITRVLGFLDKVSGFFVIVAYSSYIYIYIYIYVTRSPQELRKASQDQRPDEAEKSSDLEVLEFLWRNVGALILRLGFWGFLIIVIVQYTPNPVLIIKAPIVGCREPSWLGSTCNLLESWTNRTLQKTPISAVLV